MENSGISVTNEQLNPLVPISDSLIPSSFNSIGTKLDPTITLPLLAPPTFSESPLRVGGISNDSLLLGVSNTSLLKSTGGASDLFPTAPIPEGMGIVQRSSNVATLESPGTIATTIDLPPQLPNSTTTNTQQLTPEVLADLKSAAIARWANLGLSTAEVEKLQGTKLVVDDLASNTLAETQGYTIILDWDASGIGWYVDATPLDNAEFSQQVSATELVTNGDSVAFRKVDLLSTLTHEFGHILGLEHSATDALMRKSLPIGERLFPSLETLHGIRKDGVVSDRAGLAGADLVITNFTIDAQASWGQSAQISWTVTNQGDVTANSDWYDNVYLTDGTNYTNVGSYVIDVQIPLAPGESYTKTVNINIPYEPSKNKLIVFTDTAHPSNGNLNNLQAESNENNNSQVIATFGSPDLSITDFKVDAQASWGQSTQISWTVKNQGNANANRDWYDNVYLTDGTNYTNVGSYIIDAQTPLAPGASYTKTVNINIPYEPSKNKLIVFTDTAHPSNGNLNNLQAESNENNNSQVIATFGSPDLVITDLKFLDPIATWGQSTQISWTVTNQGSVNANRDWYDNVWLTDGTNYTNLGSYVIDVQTPLAPGASYTKTVSINIPYDISKSKIQVFTDTAHPNNGNLNNLQAESNEDNNSRIIDAPLQKPDLVISDLKFLDPIATWGQSTQISWTVTNQGSVNANRDWYDNVWLTDGTNYTNLGSYVIDVQTPLAPGASYTKTVSINIPYDISKSKIQVFTDTAHPNNGNLNNLQAESNEDNNSRITTIGPQTNSNPVDLVITNLSLPSINVTWGQTTPITWIVKNQGSYATTVNWTDYLYASDDDKFDINDIFIGTANKLNNIPLNPGESYTNTQSFNISGAATGKRYLLAVANRDKQQIETDGTNNVYALDAFGDPDLTITTATAPGNATAGETVPISWTVTNTGTHDAIGTWFDAVYLSDDLTIGSTDTLITSVAQGASILRPGESYTATRNVTIPSSATDQQYLLFATNRSNSQRETNSNNNTKAVKLDGSKADLVVSKVIVPANATWGDTVPISWTVTNQGKAVALTDWLDYVYVSSDNKLDTSDTLITYTSVNVQTPLAAGDSYTITQNITIPTWTAGKPYLLFVADRNNYQSESNKTNNINSFVLNASDLAVTNITAPTTATWGATIPVTWTVTNQGGLATSGNWFDGIYLSNSSTFDNTAVLVGQTTSGTTAIAGGASYTQSANITLPSNFTGQPYLFVVSNSQKQLLEAGYDNNINSVSLNVQAPDLVVINVNTPVTITPGELVNLAWTVKNQGSYRTDTNWRDRVYLSTDDIVSNEDLILADLGVTNILQVGDTYTLTAQATLPQFDPTKTWKLLVKTDANSNQSELVETNNVAVKSVAVTAADLAITTASAPSQISVGGNLDLNWTVQNQGIGAAIGNWSDKIYISNDAIFDATDRLLTTDGIGQISLASGNTYNRQISTTLPNDLTAGTKYLFFITDGNSNLSESNEGNNFRSQQIIITAPDLQVDSLVKIDNNPLRFGSPTDIAWTVSNIGAVATTQNWHDRLYLSRDNQIDANDLLLTDAIVSGLNAGSSYTKTATVNLPLDASWTDGSYYLLLQTDRDNQQQETDKSNNFKALNVSISVPPTPDLIVTQISAPSREFSGQKVQVSWQVKNQGTSAATGTWVDRLFLGNNNDPNNSTKVSFGDYTFTGTLEAGQTITRVQEITLPIDWSGDRWISVQTDATGTIYEHSAESNNTTVAASPLNVQLSPFPNLQVTSVLAPATAFAKQQTNVRWTVSNTGTGATSSPEWTDQVWLSLDSTVDAGDILLGSLANLSYLNPGESYTNSLDVTLPDRISANYYFLVKTDGGNQVYEFNKENDNLGVSNSVEIKPTLPIDLQVTKVTAPSQVFSGQNVSLNWQVTNKGQNKTPDNAAWDDDVFLSKDNALDSSDISLGRFSHNSIIPSFLNPSDSYSNTQLVTLPVGISGDYYFLVRTDSTDTIYERGYETNNVGVSTAISKVNLTPPPDLEVETVSTTATNLRAGQSLTINYQVANNGATVTPNYTWDDSFYLSTDNQLDPATDLKIGSLTHSGVLDIGTNYQGTATITLPNGTEGTYYILVKTDVGNSVFELNKANNIASSTQSISIISRPADLIASISSDSTAEAGKFVKVNWTVTNQGIGDTIASSWQDRIIASKDNILGNGDDLVLGTFNHNGLLTSGQSYGQSQSIAVPFGLVGQYSLFVQSDGSNSVYEAANENNNTAVTNVNITRQTPDLQVTQAIAATTAVGGGTLAVNWTVQNLGAGKTNANFWYDSVYLSADGVVDSQDLVLGQILHTNALDAQGQYSVTKSFDLPIDLAGNLQVIVRTDDYQAQVIEGANEDNNTLVAGTVNITRGNTPNLVAVSINAPPTQAIGGQPFNLTWNVRNDGLADVGSDRAWSDTVYLSRDQIFDPSTDLVLGYQIHQGGLAIGQTYTQTKAFDLPVGLSGKYYVFVQADSSNQIYERNGETNNVTFNTNATQIIIPNPADLVAANITVPTTAVLGQNATISYTVNNIGLNPAQGTWNDSIYLSADDKWDASDILIGRSGHTGDIAAGGSYTNTLTAPIPGVLPGDYHIIVRSDSRNQVRETDETNNTAVSAGLLTVDAQTLVLNNTATGVLAQSASAYYRIDVKAGETLQVKLDSLAASGANELYIRYGSVPSRNEFDYSFNDAFNPDQQVLVPTTRGGTYYVLAYGNGVSTPTSYSLSAKTLDLSVLGLTNNHGSNLGQTTIGIDGAKFSANAQVSLVAHDGTTRIASNVQWKNSTELWANFDLRGLNVGDYAVRVNDRGNVTSLNDSFTVNTGIAGRVDTRLVLPTGVRPGQVVEFSVEYTNIGETDVVAPLLSLSIENGKVKLPYDTDFNTSNFQFLGISDEGPAGTLAPGATGRVTYLLKPTASGGAISIKLNPIDPNQPIDWSSLSPSTNVDSTISRNFAQAVGNNFGTYQAVLADNASYLSLLGERTNDVTRLVTFEAAQAIGGIDREKSVGVFGHSWTFPGTVRANLSGNGEVVIAGGLGQLLPAQLTGTTTNSTSRHLSVEQFLPVSGTPSEYRFLLQSDGTYTNAGSKLVKNADRYELTNLDGAKYVFRADGQVDYTEDVNGYRVTAVYTANLLTGYTSSSGDRIDLTYNSQQRIASITDRVGNNVTFGYDTTGAYLKTVVSPTVNNTFSYDDPDRLDAVSKIVAGDGSTVSYDYDSHGRLHQMTAGSTGQTLTYSYDSAGGQTVTDATGAKSTVLRNDLGQVARTIDTFGNVTQYKYDGLGRASKITDAQNLETNYVYDYRGNVIKTIDPDGHEVKYAYTADRNLLESFTDSRGNAIRYKYDTLGQLQTITYADNSKETFGYDAFGLIQTTDRSNRANTAIYNSNYQLTQQTYADGSALNYTYDATTGQLKAITDNSGSTNIDYDLLNRHYSIAYANGRSVAYTYNTAGNITQLTQNGATTNYLYDTNGRLEKLTNSSSNLIVKYAYDNAGRLAREDRANGTYVTYTYDLAGQVLSLVNHAANGTLNSSFTYTYNPVGQRTTMTTLDGKWSYSYDGIGQLTNAIFASTNANIAGQDLTYVYDVAGNRVKTIENGTTSNYQSNNLNEYTGAGTTTFGYDPKGNITSKQTGNTTWNYTYNDRAQLVRVSDTSGNLTTYEYDVFGNRSASVYNGSRTEYLVDPSGFGNVLAEYDGSGNLKAQYTHGLGLISQKIGSDTAFYDFDALGSTADVTSSTGAIVNKYSYNPFGTNIYEVETRSNTFEYVGKYGVAEEANGLSFMRTRFYDGEIGRFTSPDTIGYQGRDTNFYRYVNNSPTNFIDPEGTYVLSTVVAGALASPAAPWVAAALIFGGLAYLAWQSSQPKTQPNLSPADGQAAGAVKQNLEKANTSTAQAIKCAENNGQGSGCSSLFPTSPITPISPINPYIPPYIPPFNPNNPNSPSNPNNPNSPSNPNNPNSPSNPNNPNSPSNPNNPNSPSNPNNPFNPNNPNSPLNPNNPNNPFNPNNPNSPLNPNNPNNPFNPNNPNNPFNPNNPNSPFNPNNPNNPFGPNGLIPIIRPRDPNDIAGPKGFGAEHWINAKDTLPYKIQFENAADATAPVHEVRVTQQLDADLDWRSFRVGSFGWGDLYFNVPSNKAFYNERLDLTAKLGFFIDVVAGVNAQTGEAFWTLTAIDPTTGEKLTDAAKGFLPPNLKDDIGQGFLNYTIKANKNIANGATIEALAQIFFDDNEPIDTPKYTNTIDIGKPTSSIKPLAASTEDTNIALSWAGNDNTGGSAISSYTVYVAKDGGAYTPWLENTTLTDSTYIGEAGHSYAFYSLAKDNAGNVETALATAQASISINSAGILAFGQAEYQVHEDGTAIQAITITRINGSKGAIGASIELTDGTATGGADYNSSLINVSFADGETSKTVFVPIVNDSLVENAETINLRLTNITGGGKIGDRSTATLTILDNIAPTIANIVSPSQIKEGQSVQFTATATDPDLNDALTYSWNFGDNSQPVVGQNANHTFVDNGNYNVVLTVNDLHGGVTTQTTTVKVDNVAPIIVSITKPNNLNEGQSVEFIATATDAGVNDTLTYSWNFGDNTALEIGQNATHTFADNGNYNVVLTVTDNNGGVTTQTTTVKVDNVAPTIVSITKPEKIDEGQAVEFTATVNDPGVNDTLTYSWNFGDNTPPVIGQNATHAFADNGNYDVVLTVTDKDGGVITQTTVVKVDNVAPIIVSISKADKINEGQLVQFTATVNDPGVNDTLTYSWNFGDNTPPVIGQNAAHAFADNGNYDVVLTVTDKDGSATTQIANVTVDNINPIIVSITKPDKINEGQAVEFKGIATDVGINDTLTYSWNFGDNSDLVIGQNATHAFADNGNYNVVLTVTDKDGAVTTQTTTVKVDNVAPTIVSITKPDKVNEGQLVQFTAIASDAGINDTLTYSWTFGDNTQSVVGQDATHTFADNGNYNVVLTVTDKDGAVTTQTTAVKVDNVAPTNVVILGQDKINRGQAVDFQATATDAGINDTLTYSWNFGDNTASVIGQNATHTFGTNGNYNIILTVTDKDGAATTQTLAVKVDSTTSTVVSIVKPNKMNEGQSVKFQAKAVKPNNILTYSWNFGDNTALVIGQNATHTFADNGNYNVVLTITDKNGVITTQTAIAKVDNVAPTIVSIVKPDKINEGQSVEFKATATDVGIKDTLTYSWNFGDNSQSVLGQNTTHTFADNGNYNVVLTVTDKDGAVTTKAVKVKVDNVTPTIVSIVKPNQINEGQAVEFKATATDVGIKDTLTYRWNFGDNTALVLGQNATHTFADNGNYNVVLTVIDKDGGVTTQTTTVKVDNVAPTIVNIVKPDKINEGQAALFKAIATDPGIKDKLTYSWNFGDNTKPVTGQNATHTFVDNGNYNVVLTVTDKDGAVTTQTIVVTVDNVAPTIVNIVKPTKINEGQAAQFKATATDPGKSDTLTYNWNFGDNTQPVIGQNATHTFTDNGNYNVILTVTDKDGSVTTKTTVVKVDNVAPKIVNIVKPTTITKGQAARFGGIATDIGLLDTLIYSWNFGDNTQLVVGQNPAHIFTSNGYYDVVLTVTDKDGGVTTKTVRVKV